MNEELVKLRMQWEALANADQLYMLPKEALIASVKDLANALLKRTENDHAQDLAEAIRLTVEYVGNDMLPALEGWSWFDALKRYDASMARQFEYHPIHLGNFRVAPTEGHEDSNLVAHAKYELELLGEEPETIAGYLNVIQAFANMGHSGGSMSVAVPTIYQLLKYKNLMPLTDNPDEWIHHDEDTWGAPGGIWQNTRNGEAFSHDGGKTYYLLSDGADDHNPSPIHKTEPYKG